MLVLNIDQFMYPNQGCDSFLLQNSTGNYSALNIGGYGTPNVPNADWTLQSAILSIQPYLSTGNPYLIDTTMQAVSYANWVGGTPLPILGTAIGFSAGQSIASGIYQITYTEVYVNTNLPAPETETYADAIYLYINCAHLCCSAALWAKWAAMNCGCGDNGGTNNTEIARNLAIEVSATIQSIPYLLNPNTDCFNLTKAQNLVTWLNGVCNKYNNCGCDCQ